MATDIPLPKGSKKPKQSKVTLKPGFHLIDWMRLIGQSNDMSGLKGGPLREVTMKELRQHKSRYDCWTAYNGKVYNIGPYIPFHPGGEEMLLRGAGRDCTAMYNKYHAWVNFDNLMGKSLVGKLIVDTETIDEDEEVSEEEEEEEEEESTYDDNKEDKKEEENEKDLEKEVEVKLKGEEEGGDIAESKQEEKERERDVETENGMKYDIDNKVEEKKE